MQLTGKEMIKLLLENGWTILRIEGSHYRMGKGTKKVTVPVHGNKNLAPGLLNKILKDTGLK